MTAVVAIDGPSGSGKSTVARGVGARLGLEVLDTGAMYRAVALAVIQRGIDPADGPRCVEVARTIDLDVADRVLLDGTDVSAAIRGPAPTAAVSAVSAHRGVREILVARQRKWVEVHGGGVVEGRDIGTVVFPDAAVKVFLTASHAERTRRRHRDETAADREVDVEAVAEGLARRDELDSSREASPLAVAPDALLVDTTGRTVDDVVDEIVERFAAVTQARS
jgi:cytidylate kinase